MGLLLIGANPTAVDATLARIMGLVPDRIPYLTLAAERAGSDRRAADPPTRRSLAALGQPVQDPRPTAPAKPACFTGRIVVGGACAATAQWNLLRGGNQCLNKFCQFVLRAPNDAPDCDRRSIGAGHADARICAWPKRCGIFRSFDKRVLNGRVHSVGLCWRRPACWSRSPGPPLVGRVYTADDLGAFHLPMRAFYQQCLSPWRSIRLVAAIVLRILSDRRRPGRHISPLALAVVPLLPLGRRSMWNASRIIR